MANFIIFCPFYNQIFSPKSVHFQSRVVFGRKSIFFAIEKDVDFDQKSLEFYPENIFY